MEAMKPLQVLLIGGTGVLSTAVTREALKQGIKVTMINRGRRMSIVPDGVELIKADKDDKRTIARHLQGKQFDAVMDFLCFTDKQTEESFNFYGNYTEQYFFISSCAVYDKTVTGTKTEDSPKGLKIWSYSLNKWASEQRLMKLAKQSSMKYTIVRPCVTYGDTRIPYGIAPQYGYHWTLVERILHGKPIIRWNGGTTRTNMMRVEDFAVGVVGLIGNPKAYNEAFNICGDETPSFNDVLTILGELTNKKVVTVDMPSEFYAHELPERAGEILGGRSIDAINSNAKIKTIVPNFKQSIPLREGLAMTFKAYAQGTHQMGIDWAFDGDCDRIIAKWCRKNGIDASGYHLCFIDYLGTATNEQKSTYHIALHKNRFDKKIIRMIKRINSLVHRAAKKLITKILPPLFPENSGNPCRPCHSLSQRIMLRSGDNKLQPAGRTYLRAS